MGPTVEIEIPADAPATGSPWTAPGPLPALAGGYRRLARSRMAVPGLVIVGVAIVLALLAPVIAGYDPADQDYTALLQPPSVAHLLGTDKLGRDILARLIYGTRVSILAGTISIVLAVLVGTPLGTLAGFAGGWVDRIVIVVTDSMLSFPPLVLAMGITAALGPSLRNVMIAVGFVYIPYFARLARGQTLSVREKDYMQAARALGAGPLRLVWRHVLPNIANPIIVQATTNVAFAMLWEASLSFLGLGVQPPTSSWGSMLHDGYGYIYLAWWMALPAGIAIVLVVLGFSFLGDGLRDALDPSVIRASKGTR